MSALALLVVTVLLVVTPATCSILVYWDAIRRDAPHPAAWGLVVWFTGGLAAVVYLISRALPDPDVPPMEHGDTSRSPDFDE